jgi:hypothetical protein
VQLVGSQIAVDTEQGSVYQFLQRQTRQCQSEHLTPVESELMYVAVAS